MSRDEFFYLCALAGGKEVFGIEDEKSLYSLPEEKLKERWEQIKESLCKKKYASITQGGELKIDRLILYIVSTCISPSTILLTSFVKEKGIMETKTFYINAYSAIEIETDRNLKEGLVITPHKSAGSVYQSIYDAYFEDNEDSSGNENQLSEGFIVSDFKSLMKFADNRDFSSAARVLTDSGLSVAMAEDAAKGLVEKKEMFIVDIVDMIHGNTNAATKLFVFNGEKVHWEIDSSNSKKHGNIIIKTANSKETGRKLWDIVVSIMKGFVERKEVELIE